MTQINKPHQRKTATSNTQVGIDFENLIFELFSAKFPSLKKPFPLPVGHGKKKDHKFDMGCSEQRVIIECKSHTWTEGDNIPSAKLTTWDQAMFYFFLAPKDYKKIFVAKHDVRPKSAETLCAYYLRTHFNVIPEGVEFWEVDEETKKFSKVS